MTTNPIDPDGLNEGVTAEELLSMMEQFTLLAGALKTLVAEVQNQGFTAEQAYQIVTDLIHQQSLGGT